MKPDWLTEIPRSWDYVPFGCIFTQSKRKNSKLERDFVLSVVKDRGVLPYAEKGNIGNKVSDDLSKYKLVDRGDFVLNSMNLYMGSVGVSQYDGVTSAAYLVCKPRADVCSGFYSYVIQSRRFQEYVGLLGKGIMEIREAVRWTALKSVSVPFPDIEAQHRISLFLDRETARISQLIERKQRLVELLNEKWGATLRFAVTEPSKETESWKKRRLKHHVNRLFGGGTPSKERLEFWSNGTIPWVSPKDMKRRHIESAEDQITPEAVRQSSARLVPKGSVLMVVRSGILRHTIPVAINLVEVSLNQDLKAFTFRETLLPEYFIYWVEGNQDQKILEWTQVGATVENINVDLMLNSQITVPSITKQLELVKSLNKISSLYEAAILRTKNSIQGLREYRSALITAAVTGRIDVRTYRKSGRTDRRLDKIQEEMGA